MKRHRSVLSRLERIKILQERGVLDISSGSVLGLPKVKNIKIKIKKEKAAKAEEAAAGTSGAEAAAGQGAAPVTPKAGAAPPAKGAAAPKK